MALKRGLKRFSIEIRFDSNILFQVILHMGRKKGKQVLKPTLPNPFSNKYSHPVSIIEIKFGVRKSPFFENQIDLCMCANRNNHIYAISGCLQCKVHVIIKSLDLL